MAKLKIRKLNALESATKMHLALLAERIKKAEKQSLKEDLEKDYNKIYNSDLNRQNRINLQEI